MIIYLGKVMPTSKRQENQVGECELWGWVGEGGWGYQEKKAKVTVVRQCL